VASILISNPSLNTAGVPRILEDTLPGHLGPHLDVSNRSSQFYDLQDRRDEDESPGVDWAPFAEYMKTTRININVRQVFPRGFEIPTP
jgi:alkylated DNA repair protein alkB homolog 1